MSKEYLLQVQNVTKRYGDKIALNNFSMDICPGEIVALIGENGAGKTTQIELLRDYLSDKGYDIIVCREPGGTPISEAVRNVILNKEFTEMGHMTELLLYAAARAQLIEEVIRPALEDGKIVICDRCTDCLREMESYEWVNDGSGHDVPRKENDHAMDEMRYFAMSVAAGRGAMPTACAVTRTTNWRGAAER